MIGEILLGAVIYHLIICGIAFRSAVRMEQTNFAEHWLEIISASLTWPTVFLRDPNK